jgi:Flp pilus assembly protein TadG
MRSAPQRRRGLAGDRRGIIAVMLALLALPLIGIVGLGVDYGFSIRSQALLNSAADSAALAATDTTSNAVIQSQPTYIQQGEAAGTQTFNAQAVNIPHVTVSPVSVTVTQNPPNSATFVTVVTYTATYSTWFGKFFGAPTFNLGGGSTAQITLNAYEDFHILMDTSGSMEIAATSADMAALAPLTFAASTAAMSSSSPLYGTNMNNAAQCQYSTAALCTACYNVSPPYPAKCNVQASNLPGITAVPGCAFGCHWDTTGGSNKDFYEIAQSAGIQLRLNVELSAVSQLISTMATQDSITQYRTAVYTFNSALSTVYTLSTNLLAGASAAANVTQPVQSPSNEPDTNLEAALTSLSTIIPTPGDGSTSAAPKEFLFIITDGIDDYNAAGCANPSGRCQQPIDPTNCTTLKNNGVQILVLYVQYVPLDTSSAGVQYENGWYEAYIQQYVDPAGLGTATPAVQAALQSCASSGLLFYAADSSSIGTQLNAMLLAAENQGVRLVK